MKALLAMVALTCLLQAGAQASKTVLTKAPAAAGGFSEERLKRICQNLQSWVDARQMDGYVGFISRNGKFICQKAFDYDNIDKNIPMRTNHIFRIASQTMAITKNLTYQALAD